MPLTLAAITDLHFGPRALFKGKLRKLSDLAPALTRKFVEEMNLSVRPDVVFALGDLIEDESREKDELRYAQCVQELRALKSSLFPVIGNHDTKNLSESFLQRTWGLSGPLYYSFDKGPFHFSVLHTVETKDVDIRISAAQLAWLEQDLAQTSRPTVVAMHHPASEQNLSGNPWFSEAKHIALVRERAELRGVLARSGNVVLVLNGHLHWNHIDMHDGIPYVTLQSLTENVDEDAPGRAANAWAIIELSPGHTHVAVRGEMPLRFEHHY